MKTASRKAKGRNLQYWVAEKVCQLFGIVFEQQNDLCPIHSREMGQSGTDIVIREQKIYNNFIYDVECKNVERVNIYDCIKQAKDNTKKGRQWLLIHKKNRHKPIAILDADHFFELLSENRQLKTKK